MGIKPLYYWCLPNGGLVFASEIKAFLKLANFSARLDRRSISQFLEFGYSFDPERTILQGVRKLPPGHLLQVRSGEQPKIERYFVPILHDKGRPRAAEREEELDETLSRVVGQQLIADVPVGLLLSGGLDSSLIAALAARQGATQDL